MKNKLVFAAVTALALGAHAGVISLGDSWTTGTTDSVALTGESATGFTAATTRGAWMYQLASASDFTAESFGVGDTATMSFTTTLNADATTDNFDYRFAMWDETGQGGASVRMDWGALSSDDVAGVGVGTPSATGIGSWDNKVFSGAAMPTTAFTTVGTVVDVSMSVTKRGANLFDVSLTLDDMTISTNGISNADGEAFDSISGVGIRLNAAAGHVNDFTVSNVSVSVIPEPATLGLVAMVGAGLIAIRRLAL